MREERKGEEESKGEREKRRRGESAGRGLWRYIKQYFRWNYRRKLIAVGAINFRR